MQYSVYALFSYILYAAEPSLQSQTPTWKLENHHVPLSPNLHQNSRYNSAHRLMTLQRFKASHHFNHNAKAKLEWGEGASTNPSKLLLDYLYACTLVSLWGIKDFKDYLAQRISYTPQNSVQREYKEQKEKEKEADGKRQLQNTERAHRAAAREETDVCDVMSLQAMWNFQRMGYPELAPTFEEEQLKKQEIIKAKQMDKVRKWQQSLAGLSRRFW